jgi:hypothetical protein
MYHIMVFVYQVVTMEHVKTIPRGVLCQYGDLLILAEIGYVLESGCFVRSNIAAPGFGTRPSGLDRSAL